MKQKINLGDLEKIIYALTLEDRGPKKRLKWLSRGFKFFNKKPGSLFQYWKTRLLKGDEGDFLLYKETLKKYKKARREAAKKETAKKQEYPSVKEMASSASDSITKWISSGFKIASKEETEKRRRICIVCPFWDAMALNATGRCKKCGCSTWAKIKLATESCPEKKW